ncbi:protein of unknown function [Rhodoferax sp. OV413]|uniref:DUF924 family protein n=1 Tax=Rhodoferax sp. OV413 TaxID=1855285 RepID=UPI0008853D60|nr:DUF924 family protein [Rhodoferax sp. OV413]SDO45415.1 protein of unknown function [Rhodoferax sp. OV413]
MIPYHLYRCSIPVSTNAVSIETHLILHFCSTELTPKQHFTKDAALDETIRTRFGATRETAAQCELFAWRATPEGRLAEILVQDQFLRDVYCDTPNAFAQGTLALALTQELAASEKNRSATAKELTFLNEPGSLF